jgi:hypothetical protein
MRRSRTLDDMQTYSYEGVDLRMVNLFGSAFEVERGPQAFFSIFPPHNVVDPHFHEVDQFQIVVRGSATLGKDLLDPITVHYTDGYTPYGPIVCGSEGLGFYNFRSRADLGAHFMPRSRAELHRRAGRAITVHIKPKQRPISDGVVITDSVPLHDDGLLVRQLIAGPNSAIGDDEVEGSGRYQLILSGAMLVNEESLPADVCAWAAPGERLSGRVAGSGGLHLLELQLPTP